MTEKFLKKKLPMSYPTAFTNIYNPSHVNICKGPPGRLISYWGEVRGSFEQESTNKSIYSLYDLYCHISQCIFFIIDSYNWHRKINFAHNYIQVSYIFMQNISAYSDKVKQQKNNPNEQTFYMKDTLPGYSFIHQ